MAANRFCARCIPVMKRCGKRQKSKHMSACLAHLQFSPPDHQVSWCRGLSVSIQRVNGFHRGESLRSGNYRFFGCCGWLSHTRDCLRLCFLATKNIVAPLSGKCSRRNVCTAISQNQSRCDLLINALSSYPTWIYTVAP